MKQAVDRKIILLTQSHEHYCVLSDYIKDSTGYADFIHREIEAKQWIANMFPKAQDFDLGKIVVLKLNERLLLLLNIPS